ncbi:MAG: MFS transporter [Cyanobacteria bacterium]|nr:MFS transporter [Cyanobacteriota bacterium]
MTDNKKTGFRWVVLGLAFFITLVNYLDRSAISYAISAIKTEFGLNDQDFGFIASAFGIGYMVMTVCGEILVDRFGSRRVWAVAALLWSACTAVMGLASGFWLLFFFRTLLGVAEGPHFPALTRVVADWLPKTERGRATALGLAAVPLASVVGAPLITSLIIHFGWKVMFAILGSLGIGWAVVWLLVFRDYPESSAYVSEAELKHIREGKEYNRELSSEEIRQNERREGKTTWKFMLTNPSLMSNNLAFFVFGYLLFFALTWLPGYFETTYNLQLKQIGVFLIAPWLTAGILLASAGFLSDWLWQKTGSARTARTHLIWSCQLLSAISFIPVMFTHDLTMAIVAVSLGIGFGLMPNAAFYALNCDLAKDRAATSQGIMNCFFALSGILAPSITGVLAQHTGSFNAAFGLLICLTLVSVVGIVIFQRPDKDLQNQPTQTTRDLIHK